MDVILFQPGDPAFLDGISPANGVAPITAPGSDSGLPPGPCLELVSLQQGMQQSITTDPTNAARTSGRPILTPFTCLRYLDGASPRFYDYCLRGRPLGAGKDRPTLIHLLRNSGDKTTAVISFSLRDALLTEVQLQTQPADQPTEQFKLVFTEILWSYTVPTSGRVSSGWSLLRNRPIAAFTD